MVNQSGLSSTGAFPTASHDIIRRIKLMLRYFLIDLLLISRTFLCQQPLSIRLLLRASTHVHLLDSIDWLSLRSSSLHLVIYELESVIVHWAAHGHLSRVCSSLTRSILLFELLENRILLLILYKLSNRFFPRLDTIWRQFLHIDHFFPCLTIKASPWLLQVLSSLMIGSSLINT